MLRIFEDFLVFKSSNDGAADRTVRAYRDVLVRFEAWLGDLDPLKVSGDELLVFTGPHLHKTLNLAPVSRTPYVAAIREFYRWASAVRKLIATNPADAVSYPKQGRSLPRVLSLANAEHLMWAPDFNTFEGIRDATMLAVLIGCGLRVGGLVGLNESSLSAMDINGEPRLAIRTREKAGIERLVPLPREADLMLRVFLEHPDLKQINRRLPDGDQVLFPTTRNRCCPAHEYYGEARRFSTRGVQKMIQSHGKRAKIPVDQLHPHALRHLYGTELAESKIDLLERQELMGHADPKSTKIYTHLAARVLTASVDTGNPLAKIKTPMSQLLREFSAAKPMRP